MGVELRKSEINMGNTLVLIEYGYPKNVYFLLLLELQGLAMSRSFGDEISKRVGVIHNPEVMTHILDKNDKFILVASDGVW